MREENNNESDTSSNNTNQGNNSHEKRQSSFPSRKDIHHERAKRLERIKKMEADIDQEMAKKYPHHDIASLALPSDNEDRQYEEKDFVVAHPRRSEIHRTTARQEAEPEDTDNDTITNTDNSNSNKRKRREHALNMFKAKNKDKQTNKDKNIDDLYSMDDYTPNEKIAFSFKVVFNVIGKLLLYLTIILLLGGALVAGAGVGYFAYLVNDTQPPSQAELAEQLTRYEEQSTLYYANGEKIADIQTDVVRTEISLDRVSKFIVDGLIATEDEYFYEHPGIVPKAILRAALESIFTQSGTGGSTLTQQLVKQQLLSNEVTFSRKANEILLALRVENYFEKNDILMAYLNVSPFGRNNKGENIAGIEAAAKGIFGISASDVNLAQAAFLVGLPQDPYEYTPYSQLGEKRENLTAGIERMHEVLFRMYRNQNITQEEYEQAKNYDITKDFIPGESIPEARSSYLYNTIFKGAVEKIMLAQIAENNLTPGPIWADDALYNEYYSAAEEKLRTGGYHVYSTIDKAIYDQLQVSAKQYESDLGVYYDGTYVDPETGEQTYYVERIQTGMVVLDNPTGRVLGFVAGTDFENNQIDHAFNMHRSPGSTIKPLVVYAPAIEHNLISPATLIPDTPFIETYEDGTTWQPTNYGMSMSNDNMSARVALYRSDNLPAVRIYQESIRRGVPIIDYLSRMGFNTIDSYTAEETQNLAFSLGGTSSGPTVFEQTSAFTTFANNGNYVQGHFIDRIQDNDGNILFQQNKEPVQVFSEDTNYLMIDMLRDTMDQGTGRTAHENMAMGGDWIAKSGISENSKDVWFLASTPQITIGSWIGYDSRFADYTINVEDGYGLESVRSQTYWARIVNDLYGLRPDIFGTELVFQQPASVQEQAILQQTGTLPGSVSYNGRAISLTQPVQMDLFKISNPAPPLTLNFLFNASEEEQFGFWNAQVAKQIEAETIRRNNANSSSSSSSSSTPNGEAPQQDESTTPPGEAPISPPEVVETAPGTTPPPPGQ